MVVSLPEAAGLLAEAGRPESNAARAHHSLRPTRSTSDIIINRLGLAGPGLGLGRGLSRRASRTRKLGMQRASYRSNYELADAAQPSSRQGVTWASLLEPSHWPRRKRVLLACGGRRNAFLAELQSGIRELRTVQEKKKIR